MTLRQRLTTGLIVGCLAAASLGGCSGGDAADDGNHGNHIDRNTQHDNDTGDNDGAADNADAGDNANDDASEDNGDHDSDAGQDPPDSGGDNGANDNDDNDGHELPDEPGEFGDICGPERQCVDDYFCQTADGDEFGVCTRSCSPEGSSCTGIPAPGTNAKCTKEADDGLACGFICVLDHDDHIHQYDCPDDLSCEGSGGPGQGHQFCLP